MLGKTTDARTAPTCAQEVGTRGRPRQCGEPARFELVAHAGFGPPIRMCEAHAWLCLDRTGATIARDLASSRDGPA